MKGKTLKLMTVGAALLAAGSVTAPAQSSELDQLKEQMKAMQQTMEEMQRKINELEAQKAAHPPQTSTNLENTSQSYQTLEKAAVGQNIGNQSPVQDRRSINDQQEAAPRLNDLTLDPKYRGFIPIPNTPGLIKFNAKPHLDITSDTRNSGNPDRFVTATIPVKGSSGYGGPEAFNVNARGSQIRVDVRAPDVPGNFRFYYQNDFFGSGSGTMPYRLQHLYGQYYNVTAGFTYSCFEDPDAWPDTVDYEGPNAVIFARRALVRYMIPLSDQFQANVGIEAPSSEVDGNSNSTTNSITGNSSTPDITANLRWENQKYGHIQLAGVVRDIGARGTSNGSQSVMGYGLNLADSINVFKRDSFQTQLTYGEGIFRYINDDFMNNDAAITPSGNLKALSVWAAMAGYTHVWTDYLRSTATFGYVDIDNEASQGPTAYRKTYYGSFNVVWQIRKRLSVGFEGLYGKKEDQGGADGDVWRFQTGLVYSLFD